LARTAGFNLVPFGARYGRAAKPRRGRFRCVSHLESRRLLTLTTFKNAAEGLENCDYLVQGGVGRPRRARRRAGWAIGLASRNGNPNKKAWRFFGIHLELWNMMELAYSTKHNCFKKSFERSRVQVCGPE
jgi:hypothetical protein